MTEEDKKRATSTERILAGGSATSLGKEKPIMNDTRPCSVCGKPRTNHRGGVDHAYDPMDDKAAAARARAVEQPAAAAPVRNKRGRPRTPKPQRATSERFAAGNKSTAALNTKLASVIDLVTRKNELEAELAGIIEQLLKRLA